ncbi:LLM class flavin-dependent oxidoreductase [Micromonospora zamorensis]|uniref:LLM class flavin-dependent oxidoreductase n=1 Tax=Micromonospora zamorensis TaxID=709883 RepID=UPI003CF827BC
MKIGIGLPNEVRDVDATVIPRYATRAEQAGFSTLGTVGRIAYPGVMDTVALAAAAGATSTIGLFSTVLLATVWPPVLLAKEVADIDRVSGGRLTLGLGVGARPDDFVVAGRGAAGRGARLDADLSTFRSVWDAEPVGGGDSAVVPTGSRRLPIILGGTSPASFRRMAQWGEGYAAPGLAPAMLAGLFDSARRAWRAAGRDGEPRLVGLGYFAFDHADQGRANVADYYRTVPTKFQQLMVNGISTGAEAVRRTVREFEALGVDELVLNPVTSSLDEIDRLAEVVL